VWALPVEVKPTKSQRYQIEKIKKKSPSKVVDVFV
jgi:hypothetical protein